MNGNSCEVLGNDFYDMSCVNALLYSNQMFSKIAKHAVLSNDVMRYNVNEYGLMRLNRMKELCTECVWRYVLSVSAV